jgi:hypothetical protein
MGGSEGFCHVCRLCDLAVLVMMRSVGTRLSRTPSGPLNAGMLLSIEFSERRKGNTHCANWKATNCSVYL